MRFLKSALLASTLVSTGTLTAQAEINVVASIKPVHSLVAAVMEGVGTPDLIVEGASSPHNYALKPSQAQELEKADLVFWVGHQLEAFLEKPIEAIATKAKAVELLDAHGLTKLEFREGGAFDEHDHEEHAEDKHDDHDHEEHAEDKHDDHDHEEHAEDKHDDHDHEEHAEDKHDDHEGHAEGGHDEHEHGEFNPHVWLDPENAKALVHEIEEALIEADPANASKYEANAKSLTLKLDNLLGEVSAQLAPVKGKAFIVFHDAYHNFENRFGLSAVGSITVSPEVLPGAERISELQDKVKGLSATCVFSEPQFEPKLVTTVTEGTQAKTGILDPLGTSIDDGPELYFTLLRNMANSFKSCLSEAS